MFGHLSKLTGSMMEPRYGPPKDGEVFKIYLDVDKARRQLGWEAGVSLDEGLARTVDHLKAGLEARG